MVSYRAKTKTNAQCRARKARMKGLKATVYKKDKGYGVSVTRK